MIVAFTGHRPDRLGENLSAAWISIKEFLIEVRPSLVVSGMAEGVDAFAFDIAYDLKIPVLAAVPWMGHGYSANKKQQEAYLLRLERAVDIVITSPEVTEYNDPSVFFKRNQWMVDLLGDGDVLASVWDGKKGGGTKHAIDYAEKTKKTVRQLKWL